MSEADAALLEGWKRQRLLAERLDVPSHLLGERDIVEQRQLSQADVELAVDEALSVQNGHRHRILDGEARMLKVPDDPLARVLSVAAVASQQDAGVPQPRDLQDEPAARGVGLIWVGAESDNVQAPARTDMLPQAHKQLVLEVWREAIDGTEEVVGDDHIEGLADQQPWVRPVPSEQAVFIAHARPEGARHPLLSVVVAGDRGPPLGRQGAQPAKRVVPGACVEHRAPGPIAVCALNCREQGICHVVSRRGVVVDRKRLSVLLGLLALYCVVQVGPAVRAVYTSDSGRDFATYHYAAQVAAAGGDPYDVSALSAAARAEGTRRSVHPYFYPPPFLLGMLWTLPLSMAAAYRLFFWANQVALLLSLWVLRRWSGASWIALGAVAATLTPLGDATKMGQANHVVLLVLLVALWRGSGAWLSLSAMAKMSPALFLSLWGIRRRWRPVLAAIAGAILLSLLSLPLVDLPTQIRFYTDILPGFSSGNYHGLRVPITLPANHSIPDLYNQRWPGPSNHELSAIAQRASGMTSAALLALIVLLGRRTRDRVGEVCLAGALTTLMVITPVYTYEHHFVFLLIPASALALAWERGRLSRRGAAIAAAAYFFAAWPLYILRPIQKAAPESISWLLQESKFFGALLMGACCLWVAVNSHFENKTQKTS